MIIRSLLFIASIKRSFAKYKASQIVSVFVIEYFRVMDFNFLFFKSLRPSNIFLIFSEKDDYPNEGACQIKERNVYTILQDNC